MRWSRNGSRLGRIFSRVVNPARAYLAVSGQLCRADIRNPGARLARPPGLLIEKSCYMRASIVAAISLTLLLGTFAPFTAAAGGDPLFAAPFLSYDTGINPTSVAVRDLNEDGELGIW